MLGGGSMAEIENLRNYGNNLGIAFQIQDDLLDICGETEKIGKPVGLDIKNGERTLLVIHALNHADSREKDYIKAILFGDGEPESFDIDKVRRILVKSGSIDYALQLSAGFVRTAINCIAGFEDSEAKRKLLFIADFSQERINNYVLNAF
jgi:geranylgeranyl pyrophosphate synthase